MVSYCMLTSLLLVILLPLVALGDGVETSNKCISDFAELEDEVFGTNNQIRADLYRIFFPTNRNTPFSVIVSYQLISQNGSTNIVSYVSSDPNCKHQLWRWLSSPAFLLMSPEIFNNITLFTLNYFQIWITPQITIPIPKPCPNVTHHVLMQITTSLQDYSLGHLAHKAHPGNVLVGCLKKSHTDVYQFLCDSPGDRNDLCYDRIFNFLISGMACMGICFQLLVSWFGMVYVLKLTLKRVANYSHSHSFQHYGLLWGFTVSIGLLGAILLFVDLQVGYNLTSQLHQNCSESVQIYNVIYIILGIVIMMLSVTMGLPTSIYFAYKYKAFAIPLIFLIPAKILCFCNQSKSRTITFGFFLWVQIASLQLILSHACLLIITIFVNTFGVILALLALILTFLCFVNIFAILFTISAYLSTPRQYRPQGSSYFILRAVILLLLQMMVICTSLLFSSGGYVVNAGTSLDSFQSTLKAIALPLLIATIIYCVRKITWMWMKLSAKIDRNEAHPHQGIDEEELNTPGLHTLAHEDLIARGNEWESDSRNMPVLRAGIQSHRILED